MLTPSAVLQYWMHASATWPVRLPSRAPTAGGILMSIRRRVRFTSRLGVRKGLVQEPTTDGAACSTAGSRVLCGLRTSQLEEQCGRVAVAVEVVGWGGGRPAGAIHREREAMGARRKGLGHAGAGHRKQQDLPRRAALDADGHGNEVDDGTCDHAR